MLKTHFPSRSWMRLRSLIPAVLAAVLLISGCKPPVGQDPDSSASSDIYFGQATAIDPGAESLAAPADWYEDARFYHIWVNAFADSDSDGIGDIPGITGKLDYIHDLGANALWLSPIFSAAGQSDPQGNMHGYDTTDHFSINPYFGSEQDVKDLLHAAHALGMRVIFDFVPNHVSTSHPWFTASVAGDPEYADWFIWSDEDLDDYYTGPWGQDEWHPAANGRYYYGVFWSGMPDLNYRNPDVRTAMASVVTYWLNAGFDGIRVDAVKYIYETDNDGNPHTSPILADANESREFFTALRDEILDPYGDAGYGKFMVVENWDNTANLDLYASYAGKPGAQMSFDFSIGSQVFNALGGNASSLSTYMSYRAGLSMPAGFQYADFLSNHDNVRSRPMTMAGGDSQTAALAAGLNILLPGVPFIYYGNEIGMTGAAGNDINLRQDFDWTIEASQAGDPDSMLEWYRAILTARSSMAVQQGSFSDISSQAGNSAVFAGIWSGGDSYPPLLFVMNSAYSSVSVSLDLSSRLGSWADENAISTIIGSPVDATMAAGVADLGSLPARSFRVYVPGSPGAGHLLDDRSASGALPTVYLPGSWADNAWDNSDISYQLSVVDEARMQYSITRNLAAASYQFKFFDGSWNGWDSLIYNTGYPQSTGDFAVTDTADPNHNIDLEVSAAGNYTFHYDLDDGEFWVTGP